MNKYHIIPLVLLLVLTELLNAQFQPNQKYFDRSTYPAKSTSTSQNDFIERIGEWPYGSSLSVAVDSVRNIIFLGSGGAVLILDGTDITNPQLITDTIRTTGLVEDIFYEPSAERMYLACGEGGFEIWDVQFPDQPVLTSRTEIIYYLYEVPVNHVQVKDNYAYLECEWGFVRSVDISNPYIPFQIDADSEMGNPSYDIHIGTEGRLHTTGQQNYVIYNIPPDGTLDGIAEIHFTYGCHARFRY